MKYIFIYVAFFSLFSCNQTPIETGLKIISRNKHLLFVNEVNLLKVEKTKDIKKVELVINDTKRIELTNNSYQFSPETESKENIFVLNGYNQKHELILSQRYEYDFILRPALKILSPKGGTLLGDTEKIHINGQITNSDQKIKIFLNNKLVFSKYGNSFQLDLPNEKFKSSNTLKFKLFTNEGYEISIHEMPLNRKNTEIINRYNKPWLQERTSIVIDAYEKNYLNWKKMGNDPKVVAVIHRASDGLRVDKKYASRKAIAKKLGYLWGAYHLGRPGNVEKQADHFLKIAGNDDKTLLILDLEATNSSKMMNIEEATQFMNYIYEKTGKILVVYANHNVTMQLNKKLKNNDLFKRAPFWYARFRSEIPLFPKGIWNTYFLWQFSSEINCKKTGQCLYNVPGTTSFMDINVYIGSKDDLSLDWYNPM